MISKANIQLVKGLQIKKQRQKYDQFVVEGEKSITELLKSDFQVLKLFALPEWFKENPGISNTISSIEVSEKELRQISVHPAPQRALAVVQIPPSEIPIGKDNFILALDEIQDPGNLGTMIRIADWYGIRQIICSKGSADLYSPKCINSTMGSFLRVKVYYGDIIELSRIISYPLIVTALEGRNIHTEVLPNKGMIVIGNEGHGVHADIMRAAKLKLTIPKYGGAESLNAAVSAAIVLDNLMRKRG